MKGMIKVKTIAARHVALLPPEHYWDGEYDFNDKSILGRLASDGFLLVKDGHGSLHRIAPIAFIDWMMEQNGCRKKVGSKWVYAPTPHTSYSKHAQAEYAKIPQLFAE